MRNLLILLVIFLGLGAFVYFYEIQGEESRQQAKEQEESLLRLGDSEIQGLHIKRNGQEIALERTENNWMIREPLQVEADEDLVNSLVSALERAKREREFEAPEEQWEEYGLRQPRLEIVVETTEQSRSLQLGEQDFSGTTRYARLADDDSIYLTGNGIYQAADRDLKEWRRKDIFSFNPQAVERLELTRPGEVLEFVRDDQRWSMVRPIREPAEETTLSGLLTSLQTAKAQEFIDNPSELSEYGLESPQLKVSFAEGEKIHSLLIGSQTESGYYARDPGRPTVWIISEALRNDLTQELWAFREKDVIDVNQDDVAWITLRRPESELVVRHEDFKWQVDKPEEHRGKDVAPHKFWYPLDDIEFESIDEDAASLKGTEINVVVTLKDGSSRRYEFYKEGDACAARQVERSRSGTISQEDFEKLLVEIEDLL